MSKKPAIQPQDKYVLRMPDGLRDRIKSYAERHGRSMNAEIIRVLEREYPEPWTVASRVDDLIGMLTVLKSGGATDARIGQLVNEIEETIVGLCSGRVRGVDDETRDSIRRSFQAWQDELADLAKYDPAMELDEEEVTSLQRTGRTEKFEDPFGEN